MAVHTYHIRPQALVDIEAIFDYIAQESHTSAHTFSACLRETLDLLTQMPEAGRVVDCIAHGQTRGLLVKKFRSYKVFYTVHNDHINIIRVAHIARDLPRLFQ